MATEIDLRVYKLKTLPVTPIKDGILFIKDTGDDSIKLYVTDSNGTPFPLSVEDTVVNVSNLISIDTPNNLVVSENDSKLFVSFPESTDTVTITIDGSTYSIDIAQDYLDLIEGALQPGDNISELTNNAGYLVAADISNKIDKNAPITGATKIKITYDADGLVTAGADATTADINDSTNKRYVTDAEKTVIGNTSNTNTGDETTITILNKIGNGSTIDSSYLPAYVDDVLEFANFAALPVTGEQGKIYVTIDNNSTYRWTGSAYVSLSNPLDYASQLEAEANTENTKVMTALRVFQNWLKNVTDYVHTSLPTTSQTILGAISELFTNKLDKLSVQTEAGITKTFALADINKRTVFTNASAITLTIPTNVGVSIPIGSQFEITQQGDGVVALSYPGVTVNSNIGFVTEKNGTYILTKVGTDTWTFDGFIATGAKQPFSVFIDTVNGSNTTGQLEDRTKPFLTMAAAVSALPAYNGTTWEFVFIDTGNIKRDISALPNRKIKITCNSASGGSNSIFDFSLMTGTTNIVSLEINIPNLEFRHESATTSTIFCSESIKINAFKIRLGTNPANANYGFFRCDSTQECSIKVNDFENTRVNNVVHSLNNSIINIINYTTTNGTIFHVGGSTVANTTTILNYINTGTTTINYSTNRFFKISVTNFSGSGRVNLVGIFQSTGVIELINARATNVQVFIMSEVNNIIVPADPHRIFVTGNITTNSIISFQARAGGAISTDNRIYLSNFNCNNFTCDIMQQWKLYINNCNFKSTSSVFSNSQNQGILYMETTGENTFFQDTPTNLFTGFTTAQTVDKFGTIKTNATGAGTNVTIVDKTPNSL